MRRYSRVCLCVFISSMREKALAQKIANHTEVYMCVFVYACMPVYVYTCLRMCGCSCTGLRYKKGGRNLSVAAA